MRVILLIALSTCQMLFTMQGASYQKSSDAELRRKLKPIEYQVTQKNATEPPFQNAYWDLHDEGIFVDITTGEPLFSSRDKFDSGTGWPSFKAPIESGRLFTKTDKSHGMLRVEVRSKSGDAHLGHLFNDGPAPTGHRYCINSAALRFVPVSKLKAEGYGVYEKLFESKVKPIPAKLQNTCVMPKPGKTPGCSASIEIAILAGGCFWGMEEILRKVPGVIDTEVGYTGGQSKNPNYEQVHTGETGHAEAVRITFDPTKLSYADLLEKWFFKMHDPTTLNQQGNDRGTQYRSAIFYTSDAQKKTAEDMKARIEKAGFWKRPIVTQVLKASRFTRAEEYHQDYLQKNPGGYTCHYLR